MAQHHVQNHLLDRLCNGHGTVAACLGFAACGVDAAGGHIYIGFFDIEKFLGPQTGKHKHHDDLRVLPIGTLGCLGIKKESLDFLVREYQAALGTVTVQNEMCSIVWSGNSPDLSIFAKATNQ